MEPFIHVHTHTQYSILDGQASIKKLIKKAMADGMPGMAITDHGNMMGIKEFFDESKSANKPIKGEIKQLKATLKELESAQEKDAAKIAEVKAQMAELSKKLFKPIMGCEMYVAKGDMHDTSDRSDRGYHLIVLAKNYNGYKNLIKIVSLAWTEGFYSHPRIDKAHLEEYHEDLIVCSACLGGEVPKLIMAGQLDEAREVIRWFKRVFGNDYYLELQRHKANPAQRANFETYPLQEEVNKVLIELSRELDVKLICTNDVHFVDEDDAEAHDHLICLSTGRDLNDPNRMLYTKQEWMKTTAEMNELFKDVPESLSNTIEILDKVEEYDIEHDPIMPFFPIPEDFGTEEEWRQKFSEEDLFREFTSDENGENQLPRDEGEKKIAKLGGYEKLYRIKFEADYLAKLAYEGASRLYDMPLEPVVDERIRFELHIMKTMGFPGYFLIVQDFINSAQKELGVMVGPGRGSAAGSVVAYCLGITKIDPLKYNLLFERFLNPDRISLPDIDTDFDDDGRGRVLEWVENKYGKENCAHIITYSTMATKNSIKDVARVEKLPLAESNALCKAIPDKLREGPDGKVPKMNLPNAISQVVELQNAEKSSDPKMRNTIMYAKKLEGNVRGTGVHACGFIICRDPISNWVPVSTAEDKETRERVNCTQYDGHVIESTGLIKMDFLGLKTLSILKTALENIKITHGIDIDLDNIPIDDALTYKLYQEGKTIGTFQFESPGMQKHLRALHPTVFEDLIAMNALYRPGPMDYIPDFIARKKDPSKVKYDIPCMEEFLKDTYGITVYQEQVMLLSRRLADFTRGESDALRKAMGKKKKDIVDAMKPKFIAGGVKNGYDAGTLEKIWADWEKFASYAFNKSHATCYSWVAYQTAYLKAHYPAEYMSSVISHAGDIEKQVKFMDECKSLKIAVKGPDVNESFKLFTATKNGDIRCGLSGLKGVSEKAVDAIIEERNKNGAYTDIFNFVERVDSTACPQGMLEKLALAGAFDCFSEISREDWFAENEKGETGAQIIINYGRKFQLDQKEHVASLFDDEPETLTAHPQIPVGEKWANVVRLNKEKELVGMYLSGHPLDPYDLEMKFICNKQLAELSRDDEKHIDEPIVFGGIVIDFITGQTKSGSTFGKIVLEDKSGTFDLMLFGHNYLDFNKYGIKGAFLIVKGCYQRSKFDQNRLNFNINSIDLMQDVKGKLIHNIEIDLSPDEISAAQSKMLATFLTSSTENQSKLVFNIICGPSGKTVKLVSDKLIPVTKQLLDYLDENRWNYRVEGRENPDNRRPDTEADVEEDVMASMLADD
ncbi:MAG: DNA polymerase III subunit alpha [Muribaculaceae bacterium]